MARRGCYDRVLMSRLAVVVAAALGLAGCGLVDSSVTNFDLYIKDKTFTVDTQQWMLQNVDQLTSTSCTPSPDPCAAAVQNANACKAGQCFGRCDPSTNKCELQVLLSLWQKVDMQADNSEIGTIAKEPVVQVTIDSIAYQVTENTLNVPTPSFTVYAAPSTIMSPGDPEAKPIATIPAVPANMLVGETEIPLGADGRANLSTYMGDYMTPFNIIVGSEVDLKAGDTVPAGRLTAVVRVRAHAGI